MKTKYFIRFWLPVILYMIFIFYMSSLEFPGKPRVHVADQSFKVSDIALHVLEYGLFSVVLFRAFHNSSPMLKRNAAILAIVVASLYGLFDEIHQIFVPTRYFEIKDLFFDVVGSSFVYVTRKIRFLV